MPPSPGTEPVRCHGGGTGGFGDKRSLLCVVPLRTIVPGEKHRNKAILPHHLCFSLFLLLLFAPYYVKDRKKNKKRNAITNTFCMYALSS